MRTWLEEVSGEWKQLVGVFITQQQPGIPEPRSHRGQQNKAIPGSSNLTRTFMFFPLIFLNIIFGSYNFNIFIS